MNDDVERELKILQELVEALERRSGNQDGDEGSSVPASLKPRPSRNSGAVALPEPEENAFSDPPTRSDAPKPLCKNPTGYF